MDESEPYRTGLALAAPPASTLGGTETSDARVGAHRQHLVDGSIRAAIECGECHVVPTQVAGHFGDPSGRATVPIDGVLATSTGALTPSYDFTSNTCTNTYCHGATLLGGGSAKSPVWTVVDGSQKGCGSCHGFPPTNHLASLPDAMNCGRCHAGTVLPSSFTIDVAGGMHIDGNVDVPGLTCTSCHGGVDDAAPYRTGLALVAPPMSTKGTTATSDARVGAHEQHLVDGTIRKAIACSDCHVLPSQMVGHYFDPSGRATVQVSGALATGNGTLNPTYDFPSATCTSVYCHGATVGGGDAKSPVWNVVNGSQDSCGSCHGFPPPSHSSYPNNTDCNACHSGTVLAGGAIDVAGGLHIDGTVQAPSGGNGCASCHLFPPEDGVHSVHANPPTTTGTYGELRTGEGTPGAYYFGCGECHPTNDASHYVDAGASGPDVDLLPPSTCVLPSDDVKCRNDAAAAYDPGAGTCSGVYCHSSGQETPVYVTTPDWGNPPSGGIACNGCHGNPPSYASGGGGTETANSHLYLDEFDWESGHFAGVPGPAHGGTRHGGGEETLSPGNGYWGPNQVASPITCQACHYDTVDAANVLAGRFFYFDTTGDYQLEALGNPARFTDTEWQSAQCSYCHDGGIPPAGVGSVLPATHANGLREVVFDARTQYLGTQTGLPELPDPSALRPYYVTTATQFAPSKVHPDMTYLSSSPVVLTWHLANATYDSATKTCSNVACHLERQAMVNNFSAPPLVWGAQGASCTGCHAY